MLSYSFHISSKNHSINTAGDLKRVSNHNTRKFEEIKENNLEMNLELSHYNTILIGSDNLYQDVKEFYKNFFEESRIKYNQKQARDDRKIYDYFEKISGDSKKQLAVEIIVQLGDKKFWENKTIEEKLQMTEIYKKQLIFLENKLPNFKICNAIIHYDEASPHIQLVGVPVAENFKQGMTRQVSKKTVFTRETLKELQATMRENAIENFNEIYKTKEVLKPLEKGRNKDFLIEEIKEIERLKQEKEKKKIEIKNLNNELKKAEELSHSLELKIFEKSKKNEILKKENENKLNFLEEKEKYIKNLDAQFEKLKEVYKYKELQLNYIDLKEKYDRTLEENSILSNRNIKNIEELEKNAIDIREKLLEKEPSGLIKPTYNFTYDEINDMFKKNNLKLSFLSDYTKLKKENEGLYNQLINYQKKDNIDYYMNQSFEKSKLKDKISSLEKDVEKQNKIKDFLFEKFPKLKEVWEQATKELYSDREKINAWKKKIEKEKDRGMERE